MAFHRSKAGRLRSKKDTGRVRLFLANYGAWRACGFTRRRAAKLAFGIARPTWMDHVNDFVVGFMGGLVVCAFAALFWIISMIVAWPAEATDSGQFTNVPDHVRAWFKSVKSQRGIPCCDIADGHRTEYDIRGKSYWVPIDGKWMPVPDDAVVQNAGNPTGDAVVWYTNFANGPATIRCFVPGSGS